jgi:hypothetical protein
MVVDGIMVMGGCSSNLILKEKWFCDFDQPRNGTRKNSEKEMPVITIAITGTIPEDTAAILVGTEALLIFPI